MEDEYYHVNDKGEVIKTPTFIVKKCILRGIIKETNKKMEIVMNEEEFNDWRIKMKGGGQE